MQPPDALERVAFELIGDMHHDGVVYTEVRLIPREKRLRIIFSIIRLGFATAKVVLHQ